MKFNLAYLGPVAYFHLRRDFLLATKYGLESLGHDVMMSGKQLDTTRFNLIVGAYFISPAEFKTIDRSGLQFAHVNTEVIARDMLNHSPDKVDFLGAYLPSMRAGRFIWDVILDNLEEHRRYGNTAHFMRWGWHPKMQDIEHHADKSLDFYFFGLMSPRRTAIVNQLTSKGFRGMADDNCPYFVRNDRISRAKVNLNIVQYEKYTHVNSFRICYLANNSVAIVSEAENDPAGYLSMTRTVHSVDEIADNLRDLVAGGLWKEQGESAYEQFRATPMTRCLEELLDASFSGSAAESSGAAAA